MGGSSESPDIRQINRSRIFHYLYTHDALSRQEIAYALRMSLPTVTQNLRDLAQMGLVEDKGPLVSTGGRCARAVAFNRQARLAAGVEISANHLTMAVCDLTGTVLKNQRVRLKFSNQRAYFREAAQLTCNFLDSPNTAAGQLLGVGIVLPAQISPDGRQVAYTDDSAFHKVSLASFSEFFPFRCLLFSEPQAAGYAERRGRPTPKNSLYLSLSRNIAGAILPAQGEWTGEHLKAGNFGHLPLKPDGPFCSCGARGCANLFCAANVLTQCAGGRLDNFFVNLQRGNEKYRAAWETYKKSLLHLVWMLHTAFDCDIILGGPVSLYLDDYLPELQQACAILPFSQDGSWLQLSAYKLESAAVGAAQMQIDPYVAQF